MHSIVQPICIYHQHVVLSGVSHGKALALLSRYGSVDGAVAAHFDGDGEADEQPRNDGGTGAAGTVDQILGNAKDNSAENATSEGGSNTNTNRRATVTFWKVEPSCPNA